MGRTLVEIVEGAKDGERPTAEECYWAMLALDALTHFDRDALMRLIDESARVEIAANESLRRFKQAMQIEPRAYMGWSNDPANPEYQKGRQMAQRILEKIAKDR